MATMIVIRKGKSSRSICRLCFMEREQHQPIFGCDSSPLDEWISSLISLKIVDAKNAPASLCLECKTTLEDFESFVEMCRTNDRVFHEMFLQNDQKTEEYNVQHVPVEPETENSAQNVDLMDLALKLESGATIEYQSIEEDAINEENDHVVQLDDTDTDEPIQSKQEDVNDNNASGTNKKERCGICKLYFHNIDEHALSHNETYQCELCPKTFAKMALLRTHIYRHNLQRRHVCKECGNAFKYPIDLRNHILIHTQEKPFKCKECSNTYRTRTNLTRHEKSHKKLNHQCEHCKSRFATAEGLEGHNRKVVRDRYWCKVCKKKFSTCDHLVYHRKTENH